MNGEYGPGDYSKDRVLRINYSEALQKAASGWVIAREGWRERGRFVFLADEGLFKAKDLTTGKLDPFLVVRFPYTVDHGFGYEPYVPSQGDQMATDWAAMTRQTISRLLADGGT